MSPPATTMIARSHPHGHVPHPRPRPRRPSHRMNPNFRCHKRSWRLSMACSRLGTPDVTHLFCDLCSA
eukprot:5297818-Prymnesium_polylepis.1